MSEINLSYTGISMPHRYPSAHLQHKARGGGDSVARKSISPLRPTCPLPTGRCIRSLQRIRQSSKTHRPV